MERWNLDSEDLKFLVLYLINYVISKKTLCIMEQINIFKYYFQNM